MTAQSILAHVTVGAWTRVSAMQLYFIGGQIPLFTQRELVVSNDWKTEETEILNYLNHNFYWQY